ncbi:MAG TPA: hypothetical protein V6D17_14625 [Candidatus Obscuribacterales bacterium]
MRFRRRRGATLGLVAICALVVIIIGVGFFVIVRMMGGGREVANTTDAGTLNLAKKAMKVGVGPIPLEFSMITQNEVSLLTYNRLVGQAMLVALNADAQRSGQANAQKTWAEVEKLGLKLQEALGDNPTTQQLFSEIAGINNTKMWDGPVYPETITQSFAKRGGSTNIWFQPNSFPVGGTIPANLYSNGTLKAGSEPYMRGYEAINVAGCSIFGVPVFPGVSPHLMQVTELNESRNPPNANVPPNCWKVQSRSKETKRTNLQGGALAAAIVGAVVQSEDVSQFAAAIPGGYLEFVNMPGKSTPFGNADRMNGENSVFNNQLYFEPGIFVSNNTDPIALLLSVLASILGQRLDPDEIALFNVGSGCFSTKPGELEAWKAYNESWVQTGTNTTTNPDGTTTTTPIMGNDPAKYPPNIGFPLGDTLRIGANPGQKAQEWQARMIRNVEQCTCELYKDGFSGLCANNLANFIGNYGTSQEPGGSDSADYMNVEYAKASIVSDLYDGQWCAKNPVPGGGRSGLKKFDHNNAYPSPPNPVKFGETGSIWELLVQCDNGCLMSRGGTLDQIYQRCVQILPSVNRTTVVDLLKNTDIPVGKTLYLYRVGNSLVCNESKPTTYSGIVPDGLPPDLEGCMTVRYDACQVNATSDAKLHAQPYLWSGSVTGIDRAMWQTSSGHQNLLGRMVFSNDAEGGGTYCQPN